MKIRKNIRLSNIAEKLHEMDSFEKRCINPYSVVLYHLASLTLCCRAGTALQLFLQELMASFSDVVGSD